MKTQSKYSGASLQGAHKTCKNIKAILWQSFFEYFTGQRFLWPMKVWHERGEVAYSVFKPEKFLFAI